jgi:hypothetical protein
VVRVWLKALMFCRDIIKWRKENGYLKGFFIHFKNKYFCSLHMDDVYYKELNVFMGMLANKGGIITCESKA